MDRKIRRDRRPKAIVLVRILLASFFIIVLTYAIIGFLTHLGRDIIEPPYEPAIALSSGIPINSSHEWKVVIGGVSSSEVLHSFKVSVLRNDSNIAINVTNLDAIRNGTVGAGNLTLTFIDATGDNNLNNGDYFILNGTDPSSDYQIVLYWGASGNRVSGDTGRIQT